MATTLAAVLFELGLKKELLRLADELEHALESRATIDQAKGIVMADRRIDAEAAFEHLVRLSSTRHMKLREVAEEIVHRATQ
jgi:AmiR/NasT family two-component response regulator